MVRGRFAGLLTLVCLAWSPQAAASGTRAEHVGRTAYSSDEIVVRARPGASTGRLQADLAARGLSLGAQIPHTRLLAVHTHGRRPLAVIHSLSGAKSIAIATPDYFRHAFATPNDPYFESSERYFETIRLADAWDITHAGGIIIAIVDTGVTTVGDLSTQLLPGRNVIADSTDAHDDSVISHGTLVAGIAAATTNNGIGIAGAAWDTSVLPVKVLDSRGLGTDFDVAAGIVWAVDHGARIVNLSLGGPSPGQGICNAVSYADAHGALVVASAGNAATERPNYPAACPGALAVSATDTNGDFASFSSFGNWVGVAAPGIDILSTRNDNFFGTGSGTSFSAPMVSAVAALVAAKNPDWGPSQVATQIEDTAQDRGAAGTDPFYGHGLLDAYAALGGPVQAPAIARGDALEPNDTAADATSLAPSATATISPEGDVDWYVAKTRWSSALTFRVDGPAHDSRFGPNLHPVLKLYDDDLNLLMTRDDDSAGRVSITARVPAGRYYLRVTNRGGARSPAPYGVSFKSVRTHHVPSLLMP